MKTKLENDLKASVYHQMAIRLLKALIAYGAHTPECGVPCSCGYADEVQALISKSKQYSLGIVQEASNAPR